MKAERQQKECTSRVLQPSKGGGGHIVDNRALVAKQANVIYSIQKKEDRFGSLDNLTISSKDGYSNNIKNQRTGIGAVLQREVEEYEGIPEEAESKTAIINDIVNAAGNDNANILDNICPDDGLRGRIIDAANGLGNQDCAGVSNAGHVIYVEHSIFNRIEGSTNGLTEIDDRTNAHSEVHHYNNNNNIDNVWTSQDNCVYCSGFLSNAGKGHQNLRESLYPQSWTHPDGWRIIRSRTLPHWYITKDGKNANYKLVTGGM